MSDLISRSELLKRFLVNKDGHRIPERDCDNLEVTISVKDVKTIIKEQPIAYSVDKVVEKLEILADNSNDHMCESYFDGKEDGIREAIEIVKLGCVSDDVCEWRVVDRPNWR